VKKIFFIVVILTILADFSLAQEWVQTNGPGGYLYPQPFFNAKKDIFISTGSYSGGTLIRSTDNGKTWLNIPPIEWSPNGWWIVAIAPNQEIYVTGSYNDTNNTSRSAIWRSSDNGNSWSRLGLQNANIAFIGTDNTVYSLIRDTADHVLRSKNSGKDWDTLLLIPYSLRSSSGYANLIDSNGVVFLGIDSGSLVSRDQGNSWQKISYKVSACGRKGNIFASTKAGRFHSGDDGLTWNQLVLPSSGELVTNPAGQLFFFRSDRYIFPRNDTLLYSTDNGTTWNDIALPSTKRWGSAYSFIIFGDADSGLYYYQYNDGETFHTAYPGAPWTSAVFPTAPVSDIAAFENGSLAVLVPVLGADTYIDPTLWNSDSLQSNFQFNDSYYGNFYKDSNNNIFLVNGGVYNSQDTGKTWNLMWKNLSISAYSVAFFKDIILAESNNSLAASYDGGISWQVQNGAIGYNDLIDLVASHDGLLYGKGHFDSLFRSSDKGITFQKFANPFSPTNSISLMISDLYGEVFVSSSNPFSIYRSRDRGETWSPCSQGLNCKNINSLIELPNGSIAAATDSGVFILPLGGCQWYSYSRGLWTKNVPCITVTNKGELYAGSDGCGVFKSTKLFNDSPNLTYIDAGAINFDTVNVGSSVCMDVTLRNRGFKSFTINSFTVTDPLPFSVADVSVKKIPITLAPDDSLVMTICFHPPQPSVCILHQ